MPPRKKAAAPEFSPSLFHRTLTARTRQKMSYHGGDVAAWQRKLRKQLDKLLGISVARKGGKRPLNARSLWTRPHELGTIEKIVFTSQRHADVPAYVCLPGSARPPHTFFICLQGHSTGMHNSIAVDTADESRPIAVEGDRDFALGCMRRGIAALCIEQRSMGERVEKIIPQQLDYLCHQATMHALMLGTTLMAERIVDVDRAVDYLESRGDADMSRVGCMGNSGGGTISLFAAAMLDRIRFVMPSSYFCSFADSILALFHCVCNYVPHLQRHAEMADVAGLIAPRPLVIVNGVQDGIFPIEAARREYARLAGIYRAAGAADRCHFVECSGGHRFYADEAWPVMLRELERGSA